MLPHHSQHARQHKKDEMGMGMGVEGAHASSSTTRSGDRSRARAQHSLIVLPIPLLHRSARSMSAVPTKRVLASVDESVQPAPQNTSGLGTRRTTKLLAAMRRSNSYGHRRATKDPSGRGMFSTPEERSSSASPAASRTASPARTSQPPSIAQIAMGLHTSRTPHIGSAHAHLLLGSEQGARSAAHAHARGRASASPPPSRPQTASSSTRVATPLRSSLKKTNPSRSISPSASASSVQSTPRSAFSRISLALSGGTGRSRLEKFLGRGLKSPVGSVASLNSSEGELGTPRKAVRFMSSIEDEEDKMASRVVDSST